MDPADLPDYTHGVTTSADRLPQTLKFRWALDNDWRLGTDFNSYGKSNKSLAGIQFFKLTMNLWLNGPAMVLHTMMELGEWNE